MTTDMNKNINVAVIIGSLRKESINRKFANYIVDQLPGEVVAEEVNIADLPLYNQDYDQQSIDSYDRARKQIKAADAVLIVSPEHNRSMPAALKNVIDIASRPYGESVWTDKKVAIVTASPSSFGGINSALDIRKSLQTLAANIMIKPEVYLSRATQSLDEHGLNSERTEEFLQNFASAFVEFIKGGA